LNFAQFVFSPCTVYRTATPKTAEKSWRSNGCPDAGRRRPDWGTGGENMTIATSTTIGREARLQNTAGDWEPERRSRRWNAVEALALYAFILFVLWPFGYAYGVMGDRAWVQPASTVVLTIGAIFLLLVSPRIHGDHPSTWGLGSPRAFWRWLNPPGAGARPLRYAVVLFLLGGLLTANILRWPDVAKFIGLREVSLGGVGAMEWNTVPWGVPLIMLIGLPLALLIVTCAIRYDNFMPSFIMALKVSLPLAALIFLGAIVNGMQQGTNPFARFSIGNYALGVFGYVFWGFTQQLLFTAYLGTRFRKAFGPSTAPNNVVRAEDRWKVALRVGLGISVTLALLGYLAVYYVTRNAAEGQAPQAVPFSLFVWLLVFFTPITLAYGYVYTLDKRRLMVATLASSCFAFIHINSYGLVGATWLLGIILIYVSMEDRYRNLTALGFIHGFLGSTLGELFNNREAGALKIDYGVGPWNIDDPAWSVLWFPMLCLAFFAVMIAYCSRKLPGTPPAAA
jgi:hypothetical protein